MIKHHKTIVLSDIHLGSKWSKTKLATRFLKENSCDTLILHGDVFDHVTSRLSWLARVGDVGYSALLWLNRIYDYRRLKRGLPVYSFAREMKKKVKASVSYISDFEKHIVEIARHKGCDGVICGHIHSPEIREIDGVLYLNSGDWIESLSALVEDDKGRWSIYRATEQQDTE